MFQVRKTGKLTSTRKTNPGFLKAKYPPSETVEAQNVIAPVENLTYKSLVIEGIATDNNGNAKYGEHTINSDNTIVDMYSQDVVGSWGGQSSAYGVQVNSIIDGSARNVNAKYRYTLEFPSVPDSSGTFTKLPQGSGNLFIGNNGLNVFTNGFVFHFNVNINENNQHEVYTKMSERVIFNGPWTKYIEIRVEPNNILSVRGYTDILYTDLKWTIPRLFAIYGDEPENISVMTVIPTSNYTTGWNENETKVLRTLEFGILEQL